VVCLPIEEIRAMASRVERSMTVHVTIQENELFVTIGDNQVTILPVVWREVGP